MIYEKILAELQTCDPGARRELISSLAAHAAEPRPAKTLTADEQRMVDDLRAEIIASKDPFADDAMIQANIKAIARIRGL